MTVPISPLLKSIATLRLQLSQQKAGMERPNALPPRIPQAGTLEPETERLNRLLTRVRELPSGPDAKRRSKVLRLFVEAVLADEFGAHMTLDADFGTWVEKTAQAMEQAPSLSADLDTALEELERLTDSKGQ